jgi:hypothetical protein
MSEAVPTHPGKGGRQVRTETLAVAPEIVGLALAEPWKRAAAMMIDLCMIGLLSLLAKPFLGIAVGVLLALILGRGQPVPWALRLARWICRGLGATIALLAVLALGHSSFTRLDALNLEVLKGRTESPAMKKTVLVPASASYGQMHSVAEDLAQQVKELKKEIEAERVASSTLVGRARALTGTLGVTFGWSGVYFTLLTGLLNGRTVGKLLFKIRAAKINGSTFSYFDGFVRQGGYIAGVAMGMLGFLKLLWEPNRQAVEDRIAATVVVKV